MYEYIIPQEFNQDDRIGNFTMPQAAILGFGGLIAIFLLAMNIPMYISIILFIPIVIILLYLMFKKINGIPMYEFVFVYAIYLSMPKVLIYRKYNVKDEYMDDYDMIFSDDE